MKSLQEIRRVLLSASIVLGEQVGQNPWQNLGGINWTRELLIRLGQTIMNTEQLGPWHLNPGQGHVTPGWTVSADAAGGQGSGNVQPAFWADAWGHPCCPLSAEHYQLYQNQMSGDDSVYWIGVTALMYGVRYADFPTNCDLACVIAEIYSIFLRGPQGQDSPNWGDLADTGLENFNNNWNAYNTTPTTTETDDEEEDENDTYTVQLNDTLTGIAGGYGNIQPWLDANPGIGNPDLIRPGQILIRP